MELKKISLFVFCCALSLIAVDCASVSSNSGSSSSPSSSSSHKTHKSQGIIPKALGSVMDLMVASQARSQNHSQNKTTDKKTSPQPQGPGFNFMSLITSFNWKELVDELTGGGPSQNKSQGQGESQGQGNSSVSSGGSKKPHSSVMDALDIVKTMLIAQFAKKTDDLPAEGGDKSSARQGYGGYGAHGFPSLEGALLSIAFLTFAVFLIDLIQQLLSRIRTGTAGVVPLVGRRRRDVVSEDEYDSLLGLTTNVLKSVENNYKYQ